MLRQKASPLYGDVGLQYRMWAGSPFWLLEFRGGPKHFGNLIDPWLKDRNFTNSITEIKFITVNVY